MLVVAHSNNYWGLEMDLSLEGWEHLSLNHLFAGETQKWLHRIHKLQHLHLGLR